jgi:DNA-binding NtrC family response regulator
MMDVLLYLSEAASRPACSDYFTQRGCDVDSAEDIREAEVLLRFRAYDCVVTDVDLGEDGRGAADRMIELARRRNADVVPVVLTTTTPLIADGSVVTLIKPMPLEKILETVRARSSNRGATRETTMC